MAENGDMGTKFDKDGKELDGRALCQVTKERTTLGMGDILEMVDPSIVLFDSTYKIASDTHKMDKYVTE